MQVLRTPDSRFDDLADWPYTPSYVDVANPDGGDALRMHYVDAGPVAGPTVVLLHGEPTWGYLYRKMIPLLVDAGCRVVAPDLIGFGRSDKPAARGDYTFRRHVDWVAEFVSSLDLEDATYFGQDWGSLIGLTVVARTPDRFRGIVLANGGLPDPGDLELLVTLAANSPDPEAFSRWQAVARAADHLDVGALLRDGLAGIDAMGLNLTDAEAAAYDAPFPDASYQAGALEFPALAGPHGADGEPFTLFAEAWQELAQWRKPLICRYGKADPVLGWFDDYFIAKVPGAKGQPHQTFPNGGHFIQEQEPAALVDAVLRIAQLT
ncbi:MAG: alpha/beta fold hydrolase [Ilumatobacteraceae bacterium]|nr:alpha/beta fold hydrolase [Ilumatobacteraceae bacterium]